LSDRVEKLRSLQNGNGCVPYIKVQCYDVGSKATETEFCLCLHLVPTKLFTHCVLRFSFGITECQCEIVAGYTESCMIRDPALSKQKKYPVTTSVEYMRSIKWE
jgi:hypothetical protein